jgi:predicted negative regulator of RcsB-dependent stress response
MDEEIAIIDSKTRNEKIKNFLIKNKKKLIIVFFLILTIIFILIGYYNHKANVRIKISDDYNKATINFISDKKINVKKELINIVNSKDKTYSPLALYFLIDNNIIDESNVINQLFDTVIQEIKLEKEVKNLIIYKKGLFNSEFETEDKLIEILKPLISKDSVWKSHALYLLGEYFYHKNEKQKAKDFYSQLLSLENANLQIKLQAQKRLNRDIGE